jgi:hypothetical protein
VPEPSEPEQEPEPHRVTAPDPAPAKRCGSLRLRLRNTVIKSGAVIAQYILQYYFFDLFQMVSCLCYLIVILYVLISVPFLYPKSSYLNNIVSYLR